MKERASGADRWRLCNVAEWKRQDYRSQATSPAAVCNFENEGTVCARARSRSQSSQSDGAVSICVVIFLG